MKNLSFLIIAILFSGCLNKKNTNKTSFESRNKVFNVKETVDTINLKDKRAIKISKWFDNNKIEYITWFQKGDDALRNPHAAFRFDSFLSAIFVLNGKDTFDCNANTFWNLCKKDSTKTPPILLQFDKDENPGGKIYHKYKYGDISYYMFSGGSFECNGTYCWQHYIIILKEKNKKFSLFIIPYYGEDPRGFDHLAYWNNDGDSDLNLYLYYITDKDTRLLGTIGYFMPVKVYQNGVVPIENAQFYKRIRNANNSFKTVSANKDSAFKQILIPCY